MTCSDRKAAANRRNAKRSTGPRTEAGKLNSRRNAIKHGLRATQLVAEDPQLVEQRACDWFQAMPPQNLHECWVIDEMALTSLRIDRVERMERRTRDLRRLEAELNWEDHQRILVEEIAANLANAPASVVERLRMTPQGCDWLIERWSMLAHAAQTNHTWTEPQAQLAFNLLAIPSEFRDLRLIGTTLDSKGNVTSQVDNLAELADQQINLLNERREQVEDLDELQNHLAICDLQTAELLSPEMRLIRRYETALHNRLRWCMRQLHNEPNNRPIIPSLIEAWHKGRTQPLDEPTTTDQPTTPVLDNPPQPSQTTLQSNPNTQTTTK